MSPGTCLHHVINPALLLLAYLHGPPASDDARRLLLAIALQESGLTARYQHSPAEEPGPARGWWQFECAGGTAGVLSHKASASLAAAVCDALFVVPQAAAVWRALEGNGLLAACFARLLAYTDPAPLPTNEQDAWDLYMRCWRPGAPAPERWPGCWQAAVAAV